jgi:hypothetical protein
MLPSADSPSLTVGCPAGLANRLRVLVSGLAWEQLAGRRFALWWPRSAPCAAAFTDLFEPSQNVVEAGETEVMSLPAFGGYLYPSIFDISSARDRHIAFRTTSWLVPPRLPPLAVFFSRLLPRPPAPFTALHAAILQRAAGILHELRPIPALCDRINDFRSRHFRPRMIGVHVRRGDFSSRRPDVTANLRRVLSAVERYLRDAPDAGILLASDDGAPNPYTQRATAPEGVHACFRQRFGDRVVATTPRSLDRRRPEAVQDALVDLFLLRQTDLFVGTPASSFSELATFGRDVPHVLCTADNLKRWLWRLTLIEPILMAVGVFHFGRLTPFPVLVNHYRSQWRRGFNRLRPPR